MNAAQETRPTTPIKTWKVTPTKDGALLALNGQTFDLGHSAPAIIHDLQRVVDGANTADLHTEKTA